MSDPSEPSAEYAIRTMDADNRIVYRKISQQAYDALISEGGFRIDQPVPIYDALPDFQAFDIERRHVQADEHEVPMLLQESQECALLRAAYNLEAAARAIRCIVDRTDQPSLLATATRLAREAGAIIEDHQEIIGYDRPMTEADRQALRTLVLARLQDSRWIFEAPI